MRKEGRITPISDGSRAWGRPIRVAATVVVAAFAIALGLAAPSFLRGGQSFGDGTFFRDGQSSRDDTRGSGLNVNSPIWQAEEDLYPPEWKATLEQARYRLTFRMLVPHHPAASTANMEALFLFPGLGRTCPCSFLCLIRRTSYSRRSFGFRSSRGNWETP